MSGISDSGATLTITDHAGDWWYKGGVRNATPGNCTQVTGSTSTTLSLTADTTYEYHAYSATGCADANRIGTAIFRTIPAGSGPALAVGNVARTWATVKLVNRTGDWWYTVDPRSGSPGTCTAAPSGAYVVNLSNLASSTAYSDATCSTEIVNVGFSTAAG